MASKKQKMPRSTSSLSIGRAVKRLGKMSLAERIQLQVKAKLSTQEQADQALSRPAKTADPEQ